MLDSVFHPVIQFPHEKSNKEFVFDLSNPDGIRRADPIVYGIGKYNEHRPQIYASELFSGGRNIHIGVDLFAEVGTPVYSFDDGTILFQDYNSAAFDYGYTIVTEHKIQGTSLYALYGHLSKGSIAQRPTSATVKKGDVLGWLGSKEENGGWKSHVHFQLSWRRPERADMPGAVSKENLAKALLIYPDPRLVLGPIYP